VLTSSSYPPEVQWKRIEDIIETLVFTETSMRIVFPDGNEAPSYSICWTGWDEDHKWKREFPDND
jgi:hypothetical protein